MAQLNRDEQAKVDHADTLARALALGERTVISPAGQTIYVTEKAVEEAQKIVGWQRRNAEARAERQAAMKAEEDAKAAKIQARQDAAVAEVESAYLRQARRAYPSDAAFERDKAQLLYDFRREQLREPDVIERKRASGLYGAF